MASHPDLQKAVIALKGQRFEDAIVLLSELLRSQPGNVQARWLLVQSLEHRRDTDGALEQLRQLLIHVRKDLSAIDQVAGHMRQRRYPLARVLRAYEKYQSNNPKSANAAFNYAYNLSKDGQFEAAIRMYERALEIGIDTPEEVHLNLANIYMDHLHAHDEAKTHLGKALELNPAYSSAFYNLGNLAEQEGRRDEASLNFERSLETDPANGAALARLADTRKFESLDDPVFVRLADTAQTSSDSDVHLALGRAYEQLGEFSRAWQSWSKGNELDRRLMPRYAPEQVEAWFSSIKTLCDEDWLQPHEGSAAAPIFICGMFRSGSTLLEQMLASHPGFAAGGESEFFPRLVGKEFPGYPQGLDSISPKDLQAWRMAHEEQLAKRHGSSFRVTDKRPDNFLYIGLIKAVLPAAKIVVTERDWRDIATSIYSVRLGPNQNYSMSLNDIRHYIDLQTGLIDHWEKVLGSDLMRVRYEDLVLTPEATMTRLLDWLGEDWDEGCLSFHELRNSVKTASVWQVREPLHNKSIGRWKNYQQPFVDSFGSEPEE